MSKRITKKRSHDCVRRFKHPVHATKKYRTHPLLRETSSIQPSVALLFSLSPDRRSREELNAISLCFRCCSDATTACTSSDLDWDESDSDFDDCLIPQFSLPFACDEEYDGNALSPCVLWVNGDAEYYYEPTIAGRRLSALTFTESEWQSVRRARLALEAYDEKHPSSAWPKSRYTQRVVEACMINKDARLESVRLYIEGKESMESIYTEPGGDGDVKSHAVSGASVSDAKTTPQEGRAEEHTMGGGLDTVGSQLESRGVASDPVTDSTQPASTVRTRR